MLRIASTNLRQQIQRRQFASQSPKQKGVNIYALVGIPLAFGVVAYYGIEPLFHKTEHHNKKKMSAVTVVEKGAANKVDFQAVRKDIADIISSDADYDGTGSLAPIFVRLAWHCSGTYSAKDGTGGSNGAGMRFAPESDWGANKGLVVARDALEPIREKYGEALSYGDLWTLAGVVAIAETGGPEIQWKPGRKDFTDGSKCVKDGRLPDATKGAQHLRDIFYRMGFSDQEIVALSGAHCLGKCHVDSSGFVGPWTFSPTSFTNAYFTLLLSEEWIEKKTNIEQEEDAKTHKVVTKKSVWKGPKQFTDKNTQSLMMLPTDMELIRDDKFKKWVEIYAKDQSKFFEDFSKVYSKLLALGVPGQ